VSFGLRGIFYDREPGLQSPEEPSKCLEE